MTDEEAHRESEVYSANERFYEALSASDLHEMAEVWARGAEARCIHPGWDVLAGWRSIHDSWDAIFSSHSGIAVKARDVEIQVMGEVAWVHCLEEIRASGEGGSSSAGEEELSYARATNLFRNTPEGWKLILHHASPVQGTPAETGTGAVH